MIAGSLWPIFIPSKGRAETANTPKLFPLATLVVEPGEAMDYRANHDNDLDILSDSGLGIAYVRNHILSKSRAGGCKWIWMLDDDIKRFSFSVDGRNEPADPVAALLKAQQIFEKIPQLGQAALEYEQFSWSAKQPLKMIGYCDVAVAINIHWTRALEYRAAFNMKEDRDFTLQVLSLGLKTARAAQIAFRAPSNGSNQGGLHEEYKVGSKERIAVDRMVEHWGPEICTAQTKANGRYDLKINWRWFKK